jgi:Pathogenicity locus
MAGRTPKARHAAECHALEQLPNVGPAMAGDLRLLGIDHPSSLADRNGLDLYLALQHATGRRQDPCVLDTFLAITDFMRGAPPRPWWAYTAERKARYGGI